MTRSTRWLIALSTLTLTLFCSRESRATTINAASCSQSDLSAALKSASNGDTVVVPAGTCTWTTSLTYTAPGSIAIIGAGNQSVTGGGDQTVIIDNYNHSNGSTINFTTAGAASIFRLSGITIKQDGNSTATNNGIVNIGGYSQNFRMDHMHFIFQPGASSSLGVELYNWLYGVIDHCIFDENSNTVNNGVRISHGSMGSDATGAGNGSWASPTNFGSNQFIFFENNVFNGGAANDCNQGGRFVFRNNTFNDSFVQAHEMELDYRGCRAAEIYNNVFNGNGSDTDDSDFAYETRMGTALVWGNTSTDVKTLLGMANDRTNTGHNFGTVPSGWGYCGTSTSGTGSAWDFSATAAVGYPCIDQVGRGVGQLLAGLFPNKVNSTTGKISWPNNALEPDYEWLDQYNAVSGGSLCSTGDTNSIAANRDFYCYTLTWNGSSFVGAAFNGTVGTGSGTLSARPSSCTKNVAYWATDQQTLYQCSSPNTWTAYYTPYTYPHPLTLGSQGTGTPPPAPANLSTTVNQ